MFCRTTESAISSKMSTEERPDKLDAELKDQDAVSAALKDTIAKKNEVKPEEEKTASERSAAKTAIGNIH
jgi:hypothetical protein